MVFQDKYELLALRGGDNEIALPGREISSGRPVLLHLLAGGYAPENQELLRALGNLSSEQRGHVLDSGDHDGIPYVVTDTLPDNLSVRSWVAAGAVAQPPQSSESPAQAAAPYAEPGEFTRLFQAVEKPPERASVAVPVKPAPVGTRSEPPAEQGIGEFTRLLRTPAAEPKAATAQRFGKVPPTAGPAPAKRQEAASPSVAPQQEPAAEPGEFTRMFPPQPRVGAATAATAGPVESTGLFQDPGSPPTPQRSGPGEFTQAMQPPLAAPSNYSKPAAPAAPPPSEFTKILQGSGLPKPRVIRQSPLPEQPRESPQGEFTRIFDAEPSPTGNLAAPAASQAPLPQGGVGTVVFSQRSPSAGSRDPSGESEFTKMIGRSSPPPVVAAPKPPQPAAGRVPAVLKTNRSYLPLILILAGLFLLAVILILVLVLMR